MSRTGKLGLTLWLVSLVFGLVSLYWGVRIEGEVKIFTRTDEGQIVPKYPNMTLRSDTTIYPLRPLHFLTYGFFALGLILIKRKPIIRRLKSIPLQSVVSAIIDES